MGTTTETVKPTYTKLQLRSADGPVYRDVLNAPPRDCTDDEIPVIDLSGIFAEDLADRKAVAEQIRIAATNTGFFYIRNHGIDAEKIAECRKQWLNFCSQPLEKKNEITMHGGQSKYFNGYSAPRTTIVNTGEKVDTKESFTHRYTPENDPQNPRPLSSLTEEAQRWIRSESFVWEKSANLPDFKAATIAYWQACLTLARKLVRIFALSLDLPEDYFDSRVTHPGADGVLNHYPVATAEEVASNAVGLGSHTDLQLFTLLWQDQNGGLQVLTKDGQWINAKPISDTLVVNIGDFMMRLSNDYFKSTVHRVFNRGTVDRVSMPFFFGLNFECVEGVIPTCIKEGEQTKYEPMSCGDWCQRRFQQERTETASSK